MKFYPPLQNIPCGLKRNACSSAGPGLSADEAGKLGDPVSFLEN